MYEKKNTKSERIDIVYRYKILITVKKQYNSKEEWKQNYILVQLDRENRRWGKMLNIRNKLREEGIGKQNNGDERRWRQQSLSRKLPIDRELWNYELEIRWGSQIM